MLGVLETEAGAESRPGKPGWTEDELQQGLAAFNRRRLGPGLPRGD